MHIQYIHSIRFGIHKQNQILCFLSANQIYGYFIHKQNGTDIYETRNGDKEIMKWRREDIDVGSVIQAKLIFSRKVVRLTYYTYLLTSHRLHAIFFYRPFL